MKPLLEQAARGIEFQGHCAKIAAISIEAMGLSTGLERLHHLIGLLTVLARAVEKD